VADYFSFEDVLGQLQLDEDELKRMVSEGELRAFRDENKMIFRKDDVENLKKGRITEPTIVLPSQGTASGEGETLLDFGAESASDVIKADDTSVPSIDVSSSDSSAGSGTETGETTGITEEMIFEDTDMPVAGSDAKLETSETYVEQKPEETGGTTEPIKFQQEEATMQEQEGTQTDAGEELDRRQTQPKRRAVAVAKTAPAGSPAFTVMLGFAAAFMVFAGWTVLEYAMSIGPGKADRPSGMSHAIAGFGLALFGGDDVKADWEKLGQPQ
jgi:hypothetical protein